MTKQIDNVVDLGYVDKRRYTSGENQTKVTEGTATFTANGAGSTTTIVGANAAPGTNDDNVVRRGDKFRLFNSSGVLKQETVFTISGVAVAGSTTITFSPAASGATASGDVARLVSTDNMVDEASLDARLTAFNSTSYSAARLRSMTINDKVYAVRVHDDPGSM